jgi:threonine aldolase
VDTNIVAFDSADAPGFVAAAREAGVLISAVGARTVRMVTHLDVTRADAESAAAALAGLSPR